MFNPYVVAKCIDFDVTYDEDQDITYFEDITSGVNSFEVPGFLAEQEIDNLLQGNQWRWRDG